MQKFGTTLLSGSPLAALPALAAESDVQTGITSVGPAVFIFAIAGALLLAFVGFGYAFPP